MAQNLKSPKDVLVSQLLKEFQKLSDKQKLNKTVRLYFDKCWQGVLFENNKMNWRAYRYVSNVIFNNFSRQELYLLYKYLLIIEPESKQIFECLKDAKKFAEEEKHMVEKEKVKNLQVKEYKDYSVEDILCQL